MPAVSGDPPPDGFGRPTWLDLAGVPPEQRGTVLCIDVPCDWYMVRGEIAPNQLFVFFPLNAQGEVAGQYFLTLEELADIERHRTALAPQ